MKTVATPFPSLKDKIDKQTQNRRYILKSRFRVKK